MGGGSLHCETTVHLRAVANRPGPQCAQLAVRRDVNVYISLAGDQGRRSTLTVAEDAGSSLEGLSGTRSTVMEDHPKPKQHDRLRTPMPE